MNKYNGCIFLISARKNMLQKSMYFLDKNYNCNFNHDILIFYHGDKYDCSKFQNDIKKINLKTQIIFHKIEYKLPDNVNEKELFYNKTEIPYVKKSFPKSREGYLHANYFWNNFMNYKELDNYDYLIRVDDDSWFKNTINFNVFDKLIESKKMCGTGYSWNHIHHRVLDTRINFYNWIKNYVNKYDINVKCTNLKKYLDEGEEDIIDGRICNKAFHRMKMLSGNFNIYNRKMFELPEWKQFNKEFNDFAGGFKYRWGDCEVISMFYYIHIGSEFLDLDLKNKNLYHNALPGTTMIRNELF
jgi:hypothetical protein